MKKSESKRLVNYATYTIGDLSSGIYGIGPAILLMFYMTNILGVPIEIATLAASLPKFIDLLTGPLIGSLSDRTSTRLGRRRPYLLVSSILVLPLFIGMWAAPFTDPVMSAWFIGAAYVACSIIYTSFLVPYAALNAEIAPDYNDSSSLNSFRASYSMLGCLAAGAGAPILVDLFGGGRAGYLGMGVSLAAIMSVSMLITFFVSKEPKAVQVSENVTIGQMLKALTSNTPFFVLTVTYVLHMIAGAVISSALAYYITYVLNKDASLMGGVFFLMFATSVIAIPLFLALGKRIGKHAVTTLSLFIAVVAASGYYFLDSNSSELEVYALGAFTGFAEGAIQAFAYSMLIDCVRHGDGRHGAMLTGVFIAFERLAIGLGAVVAGAVFSIAGLVETQEGMVTQPDSAIIGIRIATSVVPVLLNVLAILVFLFYRRFDSKISQSESAAEVFDAEQGTLASTRN